MVSTDGRTDRRTDTEGYNIIPRHTLVAGYKNGKYPQIQKALYPHIPRIDQNILYPFKYLQKYPVPLYAFGPYPCIPKTPSRASLFAFIFVQKNLIKYSENTQKDQNLVFKTDYHLNAGQKYYRTLQGEHSAILSSFTKIPFIIKTGLLSIFEWPILAVSSYTHMRICIHVGTPLIISKFATSEI